MVLLLTCPPDPQVLNTPFISLPVVLAYCADTTVALGRIAKFLSAEEIDTPPAVDKDSAYAVDVDGDFTWETSRRADANGTSAETKTPDAKAKQTQKSKRLNEGKGDVLPVANDEKIEKEGTETVAEVVDAEEKPFELPSLKLRIPKGAFVAIVGRVGSGKSSVLQALIGEMRRKSGNVSSLLYLLGVNSCWKVCLTTGPGHVWRHCCVCSTNPVDP